MTKFIMLSLSLIACNSFESQYHGKEPTAVESYMIVENDTDTNLKSESQYDRSNSIFEIPELGLKVIAVEENQEQTDEHAEIDELIKVSIPQKLSDQSALCQLLFHSKDQTLFAISGLPQNIERDFGSKHTTSIALSGTTTLYTSDLLESIVDSVEQEATILYIPISQADMTERLFDAVSYAQDNGILVFDAFGEEI